MTPESIKQTKDYVSIMLAVIPRPDCMPRQAARLRRGGIGSMIRRHGREGPQSDIVVIDGGVFPA